MGVEWPDSTWQSIARHGSAVDEQGAVERSGTGEFYRKEAREYDRRRWDSIGGQYNDRVHRELLAEEAVNWRGRRVLEVGVGTGRFAVALAGLGVEAVAVDLAWEMLQVARDRLLGGVGAGRGHFVQGDALRLPFRDGAFEAVVAINVISHIPAAGPAISEIGRVLCPGGVAFVNVPNLASVYFPGALWVNARRRSLLRPVYTRWLTPWRVCRMLTIAGLQVRRVRGHVHIPGGLASRALLVKIGRLADAAFRDSIFRFLAPNLFFSCYRTHCR